MLSDADRAKLVGADVTDIDRLAATRLLGGLPPWNSMYPPGRAP
jgi:hypothetical protein